MSHHHHNHHHHHDYAHLIIASAVGDSSSHCPYMLQLGCNLTQQIKEELVITENSRLRNWTAMFPRDSTNLVS